MLKCVIIKIALPIYSEEIGRMLGVYMDTIILHAIYIYIYIYNLMSKIVCHFILSNNLNTLLYQILFP